jgi:hypothetical protein
MNDEERLLHWEEAVRRAEKRLEGVSKTNRKMEYWRSVAPYRDIVRNLLVQAHIPICWGAAQCVEIALQKCLAGKHDCCLKPDTCFMCSEEAFEV